MAATGTPTPNIGLRIPQGTDPASVDDINYNSNLLDTKLGAVGNTSVQDQIDSLNSNVKKVHYYDYNIELTSSSGRTVSASATIAGYILIGATFVQNDDLYYLTTTDGIYPNLSIVDGTVQYVQLLGMNKSFAQVGANRTIKVRALYTKL